MGMALDDPEDGQGAVGEWLKLFAFWRHCAGRRNVLFCVGMAVVDPEGGRALIVSG